MAVGLDAGPPTIDFVRRPGQSRPPRPMAWIVGSPGRKRRQPRSTMDRPNRALSARPGPAPTGLPHRGRQSHMSAAASLAFPGSRTLGAWWRQLSSHQPEEMWVGYHTLHHLGAPFVVIRPQKLPALDSYVLKALTFCRPPANLALLADLLHLDPALIRRVVEHLQRDGLAARQDDCSAEITDAGKSAAAQGSYPRARCERQTLHFWHADWSSPPSSRFVHLPHPDSLTWLAALKRHLPWSNSAPAWCKAQTGKSDTPFQSK